MDFNEHTSFAMEIAREAGAELMRRFGHNHVVGTKSTPSDLVTEADFASEQLLVERIRQRYPSHQILTEEGSGQGSLGAEWLWVIDPLDGTVNYAHRLPSFAVSIAVARRGTVVGGVVYEPVRSLCFAAERGRGAECDGGPLRISAARTLSGAMLSTGFPYWMDGNPENNLREFTEVALRAQAVRRLGVASLDLAWVAAGVLDGYWEPNLQPWDWAAGALLVQEAGGNVTDYEGQPWGLGTTRLAATNGLFHAELLDALRSSQAAPPVL
jgi:myo-inositol-1(or 4)-monophosphatase